MLCGRLQAMASLQDIGASQRDSTLQMDTNITSITVIQPGGNRKYSFRVNLTQVVEEASICRTGPHVRCHREQYSPLWNLHVHSKKTAEFRSKRCSCEDINSEWP
jgi:hypothetical protein